VIRESPLKFQDISGLHLNFQYISGPAHVGVEISLPNLEFFTLAGREHFSYSSWIKKKIQDGQGAEFPQAAMNVFQEQDWKIPREFRIFNCTFYIV
jgi:hypothetical protein